MPTIHPLAIVSPSAELGRNVAIGPYAIIEANVQLGDDCRIAGHAVIKEGTILGQRNNVFEGAVLGGLPQHAHPPAVTGQLQIGDDNSFREFVTLHRSLHEGQATRIGSGNLMMVGAHVAHDCQVGNQVILTNGVQLAGHVEVQDRAFVSAGVGVHQFARIGRLAMIGGHGRVVQDVFPFVTMDGGTSLIVGLNLVGLRRAGFTPEQIAELKAAYRVIYRQGLTWREVAEALREKFSSGPAAEFHQFMQDSRRSFTSERRTPPGATVRIHRDESTVDDDQEAIRMRKAS